MYIIKKGIKRYRVLIVVIFLLIGLHFVNYEIKTTIKEQNERITNLSTYISENERKERVYKDLKENIINQEDTILKLDQKIEEAK